jgi:LacI family transcriptional regulator
VEETTPKRATLAAVAASAGTSVPTVSKVLRGATDVSEATRQRVMEVAQALGYERTRGDSRTARRFYRPALVDLVVSNIEGTWANEVLSGVENAATAAGSDVVITIARSGRDWVSRLLRRPSEGAIIVLVDPTSAELGTLRTGGIPLVLIDPMSSAPRDIASVGVTNWQGGRSAAEHLIDLGHRSFGIIGGEQSHLYSKARIDGFRTAAADAGARVPKARIRFGDWSRAGGYSAARDLLSAEDRPTALFACNDLMALGAYDAARELGIEIPGGLSVVGFDDVLEASWAIPPLTTVKQPIAEMGASAMRMLLRVGAGEVATASTAPREELATWFVQRGSTERVVSSAE